MHTSVPRLKSPLPVRVDVARSGDRRSCPACARPPAKSEMKAFIECEYCGLRYRTHLDERDEASAWAGYLEDETEQSFDHLRRPFYRTLWTRLRNIPQTGSSQKAVLDVGCVPGVLLEQAKRDGWNIHGVELKDDLATLTQERTGATMYVGRVENVDFGAQRFDLITLCDVARHIVELKPALRQCHRLLKPGGAVVIREIDAAHQKRAGRVDSPHELDMQLFTDGALEAVLRSCGFRDVTSVNSPASLLTSPLIYHLAEQHPWIYALVLRSVNGAMRLVAQRHRPWAPVHAPSFLAIGVRQSEGT